MELRIRANQPEDLAELFALDQACFAPGIAWSKAELGYFLKYPGNIGVIAEDADAGIAGFAIAGVQRRHGAVIGRLITRKAYDTRIMPEPWDPVPVPPDQAAARIQDIPRRSGLSASAAAVRPKAGFPLSRE